MTVTFWGAAGTVTGSMHLIEYGGHRILIDCGLERGSLAASHRNRFPVPPSDIDALVLTHAHIDHVGAVPALTRDGFRGPIICTSATRDLLGHVLRNSARLQREDARIERILGQARAEAAAARFSAHDIESTIASCQALQYRETHHLFADLACQLFDAGHILGSASIAFIVGAARVVFSGDLGRPGSPLLHDPTPLPEADLLVCESTNGDRTLEPLPSAIAAFVELVQRTIARDGKVLVPAFSLGRTQLVIACLMDALNVGRLANVPIYIDSAYAMDLTDVHARHSAELRTPRNFGLNAAPDMPPSDGSVSVHFVRSMEESMDLTFRKEPCVIIAPGGMCEGGRIVRHVKHHIDDPRCTIALLGYQAPHTLARRLLKPGPTIRIHGRWFNRWADVVELPGFSGHPDQAEILNLLPSAHTTRKVRLVHGEPQAAEALAGALHRRGFADVEIPSRGGVTRIDSFR